MLLIWKKEVLVNWNKLKLLNYYGVIEILPNIFIVNTGEKDMLINNKNEDLLSVDKTIIRGHYLNKKKIVIAKKDNKDYTNIIDYSEWKLN